MGTLISEAAAIRKLESVERIGFGSQVQRRSWRYNGAEWDEEAMGMERDLREVVALERARMLLNASSLDIASVFSNGHRLRRWREKPLCTDVAGKVSN